MTCRILGAVHSLSSCGTGVAAPQHVGSSRTRDQTHDPWISRKILDHQGCPTHALYLIFFLKSLGNLLPYVHLEIFKDNI